MSCLVDTHIWIWSQETPEKLGPKTVDVLTDVSSPLHVSAVSTLEIARLIKSGAIELTGPLDDWVATSLDALGCNTVEISHEIAMTAYALPGRFHKDPADRILVATARLLELSILTADERILRYRHVQSVDARK